MENLELQEKIINLGKQFVEALELDPGVDTFSKWMAHYIAEKMTVAEHLPAGPDKIAAEKECFETILKLWERRWSLPRGIQPFEDFTPILKTLERLNPANTSPYFYQRSVDHDLSELEKEPKFEEILIYSRGIIEIDRVARIWIDHLLHEAAILASNEQTESFLKNAEGLDDSEDIKIIQPLFDDEFLHDPSNPDEDFEDHQLINKLKRRIEELEKFSEWHDILLRSYTSDLNSVQSIIEDRASKRSSEEKEQTNSSKKPGKQSK